jgi:glutamine synthetase
MGKPPCLFARNVHADVNIKVAWGTQNRETPLRRISPGHWELRCVDGLANMYFALSAVLAAGLLGLAANETAFPEQDAQANPSTMEEQMRAAFGVTRKLPKSMREAVNALREDAPLNEALDQKFVRAYLGMKGEEAKMLGDMGEGERRVFLVERY